MKKRLTLGLLGLLGIVTLWGSRPAAAPDEPNPALRPLEYRPGAFFPEGFPLHGKVRLLTAPVVEMGRRQRVRVEYTAGDLPLEPGISLEVWKHFTSDVEAFQVGDPSAPAYFDADFTAPGMQVTRQGYTNEARRDNPSVFPYRRAARLTIYAGRVESGQKVLLDLGGQSGVRMQHYEENLFNFRLVITRDSKVIGYAGDAFLKVTGGPMKRLRVQAPSVVAMGEEIVLDIVPQDEWGSLAKNHHGHDLRLEGEGEGVEIAYDEELMHYVARGINAGGEGVRRFTVRTAGGEARGVSNPMWVERYPDRRVFYGDLHQHTYLADGRGVFEELYLYARRVGLLDFGALTPHHRWLTGNGPSYHLASGDRYPSDNWPALQAANRAMKGWRGFVPILGYEYSVGTAAGGHHNVFYNADEAPTTMHLDPNRPGAPVGEMLKTLTRAKAPTLVIPHVGGGPPDWEHPTDPRVERLYEIASVHGVFEESYQKHLEAGQRLAASASGDTHTTSFGNAYPGIIYTMTNALTGVYAFAKTRDDIWNGLYEKRTFATTGNQRILLDMRVNGERMGGEVMRAGSRTAMIEARVSGTKPLLRLDVLRNSQVIYSTYPARKAGSVLRLSWGDNIYQRRTAESMARGELRAAEGRLRLKAKLQQDQAFEWVREWEGAIEWRASTTSNDRDPILVDLTEVDGDVLSFRLDDPTLGEFRVDIPLDELRRKGSFVWKGPGTKPYEHRYMKKMGLLVELTIECDLVDPEGPMDAAFSYEDRSEIAAGDYYYLRAKQLDGHQAWSSPVWFN